MSPLHSAPGGGLLSAPGGGACSAGGQCQVIHGAEAQDATLQTAVAPDSRESWEGGLFEA